MDRIKICFVCFILISISIFSQEKIILHKGEKYEISYPNDWFQINKNNPFLKLVLTNSKLVDISNSTIILSIKKVKKEFDVYKYKKDHIDVIESSMYNSKIITDKIKDNNSFELIYEANFGKSVLKFKELFYYNNKYTFSLSYKGSRDNFKKDLLIVNKILDSFKLK